MTLYRVINYNFVRTLIIVSVSAHDDKINKYTTKISKPYWLDPIKNKLMIEGCNISLYQMRKLLSFGHRFHGGRNHGMISVPRRGSLVKRNYRFIDTKRTAFPNCRGIIIKKNIYDPNRSAKITLVVILAVILYMF